MSKTSTAKSSVVSMRRTVLILRTETLTSFTHNIVSQFTLLASTKKGTKPDFHGAMGGDDARVLYEYFYKKVQEGYVADRVKDGVFQAMMQVALVNDGPVRTYLTPLRFLATLANVGKGHIKAVRKAEGGQGEKEDKARTAASLMVGRLRAQSESVTEHRSRPGHPCIRIRYARP